VLPEKGHINPYIGPAQALQELGHEVKFVAPKDISRQLDKSDLEFDSSLVALDSGAQPMKGAGLVELVKDRKAMRQWIAGLLFDVPDQLVQKIKTYFLNQKPHVVVIDPLYYPAVIAAQLAGCRWVSMSNSLNPVLNDRVTSDLLDTLNFFKARRQELFLSYGINQEFNGCDAISNHLTVAFCTEALVGKSKLPVAMVGPSLPIKKRGDEVDHLSTSFEHPVVYASFGSQIYHWPEIFERLIDACNGLGVRLILSVGDLINDMQAAALPDFVELYSYAPQMTILPQADVFITHGGANSIMEAIYFSVPVLISPMCNDQFHQAYYVNEAEIGLVCDLQTASVETVKVNIEKLLCDVKIKNRMAAVSKSYQTDGARASAKLVEGLL
jgi:MGT family glycosyltransferase